MQVRIAFFAVFMGALLSQNAGAQLRLHGSNTVGEELAPALVRAWLERDGFNQIEVDEKAPLERVLTGTNSEGEQRWVEIHAHGSSTAFRDLSDGRADMGMSSRRIRDAEVEQLAYMGTLDQPRHEIVVGIDGLAVIVHPSNPLLALSIDQIRAIFSGRIRDWRELGGAPGAIELFARRKTTANSSTARFAFP